MENNSEQSKLEELNLEKSKKIFESILSKNIKLRPYPDDETDKLVEKYKKNLKLHSSKLIKLKIQVS